MRTALDPLGVPRMLSSFRRPYSRLYYVDEGKDWIIRWIGQQLIHHLRRDVGLDGRVTRDIWGIRQQVIHFGSRHVYFNGAFNGLHPSNRLVCTWFHGRADDPDPDNQRMIRQLPESVASWHCVVTAANATRDRLMAWGVPASKIVVIPLGVDLRQFRPPTAEERRVRRAELGIPEQAVCVGSFQKDGVGWGEGLKPKLIKGPDLFLEAVRELARSSPVFVLLTGPSRGFVKRGLERLGIPYRHEYLKDQAELAAYYHCLDLYLITSRDEGGPMSVLESMATGVPVVSFKVGMAADVIVSGENGCLADGEDVAQVTASARRLLEDPAARQRMVQNGLATVTRYDWPVIARQYYEQVYRELLS